MKMYLAVCLLMVAASVKAEEEKRQVMLQFQVCKQGFCEEHKNNI